MDFKEQLIRQLRWLDTSCQLYDQGMHDEAVRMAVPMRVLFHDTKHSSSLILGHFGAKNIEMLSTCYVGANGKAFPFGLVDVHIKPMVGGWFVPKLGNTKRAVLVTFDTWWRKEVIFSPNGKEVHRRDLVLGAANKDGGAHVDKKYTATYEILVRGAEWSMNIKPDNAPEYSENFKHAHLAGLRQIAFEILHSPSLQRLLTTPPATTAP